MISPLYGQLSPLRVPTKAPRGPVTDSDALAYIAAVETADGQSLEDAVKFAYEDFILGCKADGIWSALKASCILAGARTLSGALVPLVGTAPTNFNFVSADYNRETGLKGNGSTKYINSNRANNADPQNSKHLGVYLTEIDSTAGRGYIGGASTVNSILITGTLPNINFRINSVVTSLGQMNKAGFIGVSRPNSTQLTGRGDTRTFTTSIASNTPSTDNILVFRVSSTTNTTARISFYSVGENIDLTAIDTRVSTLMTALAAAIP